MILSDQTIEQSVLNRGGICIEPTPDDNQFQPASLDVRLGDDFVLSRTGNSWVSRGEAVIDPGERYLGTTKETVTLPNDIAAQLAGRSTVGRMGIIVHKTAGWIDPGFSGEITLEVMNLGNETQRLDIGQRIAQLVFFKLDQPSSGYDGHYQNQSGATEAYND